MTIGVDGPASRGKTAAQRDRRKVLWKKPKEDLTRKNLALGITTGTELMNELCRVLCLYAKWLHRVRGLHVYICDGLLPGEGEHKLV